MKKIRAQGGITHGVLRLNILGAGSACLVGPLLTAATEWGRSGVPGKMKGGGPDSFISCVLEQTLRHTHPALLQTCRHCTHKTAPSSCDLLRALALTRRGYRTGISGFCGITKSLSVLLLGSEHMECVKDQLSPRVEQLIAVHQGGLRDSFDVKTLHNRRQAHKKSTITIGRSRRRSCSSDDDPGSFPAFRRHTGRGRRAEPRPSAAGPALASDLQPTS